MRPVYGAVIGDSIVLAAADDLNKGGIVGRIADWALTQTNLHLRMVGNNFVTNHAPTDPDPQGNEGMGGYEFADMVAALSNRVDHNRNPTYVPMFGPQATSMYQPLDFVLSCGGANNLNNLGEPTATTHAQDRAFLTALRTFLDGRGLTACVIAVMGGYLDINAPYHTQVVAANATVQTNVYDVIDALNPGRPLYRLPNWNTRQGDYVGAGLSGSGFKYNDDIHPNGDGYDAICNGANGVIAQLAPLILAKANDGTAMGFIPTPAKNKLVDHSDNVAAYSPAATHYRHLYSDAACTVPLTSANANNYVPVSKTNNATTWPAADAHGVKSTGVAWTFPDPGVGHTWPSVMGWKITDNATEGAGLVIAQNSHAAVPVDGTTGAISYPSGAACVSLPDPGTDGVGWGLVARQELLDLMFGATANSPRVTTHLSYWAGIPGSGGTIAGGSVPLTQASVWGAAANGEAASIADVTLTQQVTGTYLALHSAATGGGTLLRVCFRPASVGSSGTIQTGLLRVKLP